MIEEEGYVNFDSAQAKELFQQIREFCLALPRSTERISHGSPTYFIDGKHSFVQYHNNHHGDGRIALWCAAPSGVQLMLIDSWSEIYFRPAYVGHLGWVGIRLDREAEWKEIAGVIGEAYLTKAAKKTPKKRGS